MIAQCKMCLELIVPASILDISPRDLARIPPEQIELMKFSAAVADHLRKTHSEYVQQTQQLTAAFIGQCSLSTVTVKGTDAAVFDAQLATDNAILRLVWDSLPNPPDPDKLQTLLADRVAKVRAAAAGVAGGTGADGGAGDAINKDDNPGHLPKLLIV